MIALLCLSTRSVDIREGIHKYSKKDGELAVQLAKFDKHESIQCSITIYYASRIDAVLGSIRMLRNN